MPTAVERLTQYFLRALSLDVVEGEATQKLFASLDTQIDAAVTALETAATPKAFDAAEHQYGHIFLTFSQDGHGLSQEFDRIGKVLGGVDGALGGKHGATTTAQADFVTLDHQLFATGAGFAAFGAAMKTFGSLRTQAELPGAVTSTAKATAALQTDFAALARETATLLADLPAGDAALAAAIAPTIAEFSALSADFADFTTLLGGNPHQSAASTTNPLTFDGVFAALDTHLIALDTSLHGLASPLASLLAPSWTGGSYSHR